MGGAWGFAVRLAALCQMGVRGNGMAASKADAFGLVRKKQDNPSKIKLSKGKKGDQAMQEQVAQDQAAAKAGSPIINAGAAQNTIQDAARLQSAGENAPKPTVSHMLGEVTWLLSHSPTHKHFSIGDLEWLVMPAILLEQFRVFHGEKHPLGFALWATFSQEVEARFKEQAAAGGGVRLRPQDWKSGDRLWLIELVAPFATPENKLQDAMLADLVQGVFKGKTFKLHTIDPSTGKREEKEIKG